MFLLLVAVTLAVDLVHRTSYREVIDTI